MMFDDEVTELEVSRTPLEEDDEDDVLRDWYPNEEAREERFEKLQRDIEKAMDRF